MNRNVKFPISSSIVIAYWNDDMALTLEMECEMPMECEIPMECQMPMECEIPVECEIPEFPWNVKFPISSSIDSDFIQDGYEGPND